MIRRTSPFTPMRDPAVLSLVIFLGLFASAMLGIWLRAHLPAHHQGNDTKEAVRIGMGSVATMAALVLGLLVASAKSAYDTEKSEVMQMAAKLVYLDRMLVNFGPEAGEARQWVRRTSESAIDRIWGTAGLGVGTAAPDRGWNSELPQSIHALQPKNDAQAAYKAQAASLANDLGQMRWLLFEQMESSISMPLLAIMVFWLAITFLSVGLFAPSNATVVLAQALGALAVAGAVFLILELDQPFQGLIQIPAEPFVNALKQMGT